MGKKAVKIFVSLLIILMILTIVAVYSLPGLGNYY